MLLFFINGCVTIETEDNNYNWNNNVYKMRFLTENEHMSTISIKMTDAIGNTIIHEETFNGLKLISVDCSPFLDTYNWENETYRRIKYEVTTENKNEIICGSFPMVRTDNTDILQFACVSGNNNKNKRKSH